MSSRADSGSIVLVHAHARTRRALERVLAATCRPVHAHDELPDAASLTRDGAAPHLLILDHGAFLSDPGQELATALDNLGTSCLVLAGPEARSAVPQLFASGALTHLLGNPMPTLAEDLLVASMKHLRGNYFGVEKYLSWGAQVRALELSHAEHRARAVARITADVQAAGLGQRTGWLVSMVTDELLTNALYDAPVDDAGEPTRATEDRDAPRELIARERVTLRYAFDARHLAVEVTDQFGSLVRATTLAHLAKCTVPNAPNKVSMGEGGAGLGTGLVYGCCSHLIYNVEPGVRTQAIALFDIHLRGPDPRKPVTSFEFFRVQESNHGV